MLQLMRVAGIESITFCRYKDVMCQCWAFNPTNRPNFSTLVTTIAEHLAEDAEYFTFSVSPMPQDAPLKVHDDLNDDTSL
jgi:hypothetical protein